MSKSVDPMRAFREARARSGTLVSTNGIKSEVVELYRRARAGDRQASKQFHRLIGYRPWMSSPLTIDPSAPPPSSLSSADRPDYERMRELRRQLDEALAS